MSQTIRKASELRPWLKHYPEAFQKMPVLDCTLHELIFAFNHKLDAPSVEYYGKQYTMNEILAMADQTAKALAALGVKCGDHLPVFMEFQPEFVFLLLAAEQIGAALVCRDGTDPEYLQALSDAHGPLCFIQDSFTTVQEQMFYNACPELKHIITLNPYTYGDKETMPDYVIANIEGRVSENSLVNGSDPRTMTWTDMYALGENFEGEWKAPRDTDRSLYHPYTSGSTGPSKEIMHSARTMTGCLGQICPMMSQIPFQMRCLLPVLPPALIAMVGPILLLYTSTGHLQILDPYCGVENHDLELMRYMPNGSIGVSNLGRSVLFSKRIPEDFQFPQLMQFGGGAEPTNNKNLKLFNEWLKKHGAIYCNYTMGFGQTEAGPVISQPASFSKFDNLRCGIPTVHNIVGVFDEDCNELDYASMGEICLCGPGVMKGYAKEEDTKKAIKIHADGRRWLHTGDFGYMNDNGEVTILSRGHDKTWMGKDLYLMVMENKIINIPGIKDAFFVSVPDPDHEGYKVPYMYMVKEDWASLETIKAEMKFYLEDHEYPVEIRLIDERPFSHFKTCRIALVNGILAERRASSC